MCRPLLRSVGLELGFRVGVWLGGWVGCACACRCGCVGSFCVDCPLLLSKDFWSGMGSGGLQAQRRESWIPAKGRTEKVLADAISIDVRKEWICGFCSGVRCVGGVALQGDASPTFRRGCGVSTGRQWQQGPENGQRALRRREERRTGSLTVRRQKELRAKAEHCQKQNGEGVQGGQGLPPRRKIGMEEEWGMDFEGEIESRKKLDEQWKKLQKDLRDVQKNSRVCRKRFRNAPKLICSSSCMRWRKRRHDLMPEHRKVHKRLQDTQNIQDKRRNLQKVRQRKRKCRKSERKLHGKKSALICCRTKSIRTEWQMRKWKQNFRDCKPEKKEEVAMHRKSLIVAWRRCRSRCSRWERIRRGLDSRLCANCSLSLEESRPFLHRCQEKKKEEETVKMNKSKAEPVSSWRYHRQAGSLKALQLILGFGVCRAKVEEPDIQAQKMSEKDSYPNSRVDVRWKGMLTWWTCEWTWDETVLGKEEKEKVTARVRTQEPLKKAASGRTHLSGKVP